MKSSKKMKQKFKFSWIGFGLGLGGLCIFIIGMIYFYPFKVPSRPVTLASKKLEKGAQLFAQNCAQCHGAEGIGEDPSQSRGGFKADGTYLAPALNGTGHTWHHPVPMLFEIIKNGSPAEGSSMLGFQGRLDDEEIHTIIAYFQSLWPEQIQKHYQTISP